MDVLLLVCNMKQAQQQSNVQCILAGIVVEYYKKSQCGLITYLVVEQTFRQFGIMKIFHQNMAIASLVQIHNEVTPTLSNISKQKENRMSLKAMFCEVNSIDAGDVSIDQSTHRHTALQKLGYCLVNFPYMQPPLAAGMKPFSPIMLLIYQGNDENGTSCQYPNYIIDTTIPYNFTMDFYFQVLKHKSNIEVNEYYKLLQWYRHLYPQCRIHPFNASQSALVDPKQQILLEYQQYLNQDDGTNQSKY
jgi:hypothetical protein